MTLRTILLSSALFFCWACGSTATDESQEISLEMRDEMLFEGSNSLQTRVETSAEELASKIGVAPDQLKKVSLRAATFRMDAADVELTESLLLQIVSDDQPIRSLGTLSPLSDPSALELNLPEDTDILPYLRDAGATWVLDLNLSEDRAEEMQVTGVLKLRVTYSN